MGAIQLLERGFVLEETGMIAIKIAYYLSAITIFMFILIDIFGGELSIAAQEKFLFTEGLLFCGIEIVSEEIKKK